MSEPKENIARGAGNAGTAPDWIYGSKGVSSPTASNAKMSLQECVKRGHEDAREAFIAQNRWGGTASDALVSHTLAGSPDVVKLSIENNALRDQCIEYEIAANTWRTAFIALAVFIVFAVAIWRLL